MRIRASIAEITLSTATFENSAISQYDPTSRASRAYDELADEVIAGTRTEVTA